MSEYPLLCCIGVLPKNFTSVLTWRGAPTRGGSYTQQEQGTKRLDKEMVCLSISGSVSNVNTEVKAPMCQNLFLNMRPDKLHPLCWIDYSHSLRFFLILQCVKLLDSLNKTIDLIRSLFSLVSSVVYN